ncbi:transcriptional regulator with XRE-family HTH domain [Streptosporangium becharense]|uniref:Tetratricopeptide (TPR) repeat protein n=2 Tax=Streptosporangium becharense TaxID=1816182 RepID=A0A7W9IH58_9ACTN|nr:transcriptional regulator with XRE-family HTH domain [Streptosporangium becharense]MBB5820486.1 tetratricopeptide (TPR) repeat protein [Streptosporangium becharense]
MSQAQLAGPDLSDSYVSLIESGKRTPTPVVARLLAERLGCTTEFLLRGIEPRQRIDTELGLRHAELELLHGSPSAAAERFGEIVKAVGEENVMLAAHARLGRARALEAEGRIGPAVEAFERLRREAAAHPERLADLPLTVALSRCYQVAGDTRRARDLAAQAFSQVDRLVLTQGEIAVDLAAALLQTGAAQEPGSPNTAYIRTVLAVNGVPAVVDRTAEIHALWQASLTAAGDEDSALAVHLADEAIVTGRPARMACRLAFIAMEWASVAVSLGQESLDEAVDLATSASRVFAAFPEHAQEHARSLVALARVHLGVGDLDGAADRARAALAALSGQGSVIAATAQLVLTQVEFARGQEGVPEPLTAAGELLLSAAGSAPSSPDREVARVWRDLGDLYGRVGAGEEQAAAYRRALEAAGVRDAMVGVTVDSALVR